MPRTDKITEGVVTEIEFYPGYSFLINYLSSGVTGIYRKPHRHRFYEMIWVKEGSGTHTIDFVEHPLTAGRIYLIMPGQIHQWNDNRLKGYVIQFTDSLLDKPYRSAILQDARLFRTHASEPFVTPTDTATKTLNQLADLMLCEYEQAAPDWNMVRPLLSAFLYELCRVGRNEEEHLGHPNYERLEVLGSLIEANYMREMSSAFYADAMNLTTKGLNRITRDLIGKTVLQMVHDRIILEAKRDLSLSQDSVKTISYRLGFDDPSYFARFFRREVGETPNEFRRNS